MVERSHAANKGIVNFQPGLVTAEHNTVEGHVRNNYYDPPPDTEIIYEEVGDAMELSEGMDLDSEVTANPLMKANETVYNCENCKSPTSDIDDVIDIYDHVVTDSRVTLDHLSKADTANRTSAAYI